MSNPVYWVNVALQKTALKQSVRSGTFSLVRHDAALQRALVSLANRVHIENVGIMRDTLETALIDCLRSADPALLIAYEDERDAR